MCPIVSLLAGTDCSGACNHIGYDLRLRHVGQNAQSLLPFEAFFTSDHGSAVSDHIDFHATSLHQIIQKQCVLPHVSSCTCSNRSNVCASINADAHIFHLPPAL